MSADEAAKKIAELSVELGYLNENNRGVNITVEGKADAEKLSSAVEGSFEAAAEGLDLRFTSEGTFSLNRELNAVKAEYSSDAAIRPDRRQIQAHRRGAKRGRYADVYGGRGHGRIRTVKPDFPKGGNDRAVCHRRLHRGEKYRLPRVL
ncbi:MAG: hypothetical protein ACLRSW_09675 [Christensenellaceae bacterium]